MWWIYYPAPLTALELREGPGIAGRHELRPVGHWVVGRHGRVADARGIPDVSVIGACPGAPGEREEAEADRLRQMEALEEDVKGWYLHLIQRSLSLWHTLGDITAQK